MLVLDVKTQQMATLFSIYAPTKNCDKSDFGNHLSELNNVIDTSRCIIGDFNELENSMDKKGGH